MRAGPAGGGEGALAPLVRGVLPRLLRDIYVGRRTGLLRFLHGEHRFAIRFSKGHIVYGQASAQELHLGEIMVGRGLLTREGLERATTVVRSQRRKLGEVLGELGLVDAEVLEQSIVLHVREVLHRIFAWREALYGFEPHEDGAQEHQPLRASTGDIVVDALRALDAEAVLFALGGLDCVLLPASDPLVRFQRVTLTPVDGFVLSRVDGTLTAREIVDHTPLPSGTVEQSLLALLCIGLVEKGKERPAPRSRAGEGAMLRHEVIELYEHLGIHNHYQLLGVEPQASEAEVTAAYYRVAKRYHPDVHHEPGLSDLRAKLEAIFFRVQGAYEILNEPSSRARYHAKLGLPPPPASEVHAVDADLAASALEAARARQAEELYQRAEQRFHDARYWEAIALLEEAVGHAEGRLRQKAWVLLARGYLKHSDSAKQAERVLRNAVQEDPENADAYYLLGTIYRNGGLGTRAAAMFRKVLELNPRHREAQVDLAALASDPPPAAGRGRAGR